MVHRDVAKQDAAADRKLQETIDRIKLQNPRPFQAAYMRDQRELYGGTDNQIRARNEAKMTQMIKDFMLSHGSKEGNEFIIKLLDKLGVS